MRSRFQAAFGCECCPSSLGAQRIDPLDIESVRREFFAKCKDLKLWKKGWRLRASDGLRLLSSRSFKQQASFQKPTRLSLPQSARCRGRQPLQPNLRWSPLG